MADECLLDVRMHDGSRQFAELSETSSVDRKGWNQLLGHVRRLRGAKLVEATTDFVTEGWIDFDFECHTFTMNNQLGDWSFFVADPACDDAILRRVVTHFAELLRRRRITAARALPSRAA